MANTFNNVDTFLQEHGDFGYLVLKTLNSVDPFRVFYGWEVNPDEYLGYARRFCESSETDLKERFRQSFYASQQAEVSKHLNRLVWTLETFQRRFYSPPK